MIVYFDTSALVKRLFDEPGSDIADDLWASGEEMMSTHIAYPEARAAVAAAHRAGRIGMDDLRGVAREVDALFAEMKLVGVDGGLARVAGDLAESHGLRGYDAVHLASALSIDAPRVVVATWDRELAAASSAEGLAVAPDLTR
jgi:predicted nucleic acid-binding protein